MPGQVILVVEEALRRMRVTDNERKVTLETLHYCQQRSQQHAVEAISKADSQQPATLSNHRLDESARPLTQWERHALKPSCKIFESRCLSSVRSTKECLGNSLGTSILMRIHLETRGLPLLLEKCHSCRCSWASWGTPPLLQVLCRRGLRAPAVPGAAKHWELPEEWSHWWRSSRTDPGRTVWRSWASASAGLSSVSSKFKDYAGGVLQNITRLGWYALSCRNEKQPAQTLLRAVQEDQESNKRFQYLRRH